MPDGKISKPVRPQRVRIDLEQAGDRLHLSYRHRELAGGIFMLLWLTGWTVGCVFLAGMVINDPQLFHFMFAIPFWASWIFVFCQVLKRVKLAGWPMCCCENGGWSRFQTAGI
ncbi:MAG TPA: hypothetical protein VGH74_10440 [Planctomycetaceae bacterium]|jgi:hypothetical protein